MSINATNWVLNHSKLTGTARFVLLIIADKSGEHGDQAWPFMETIMRQANYHRTGVKRAIRKAEAAGELLVFPNEGGDARRRKDRRPNLFGLPKVPGYVMPEGLTPRGVTSGPPLVDGEEIE